MNYEKRRQRNGAWKKKMEDISLKMEDDSVANVSRDKNLVFISGKETHNVQKSLAEPTKARRIWAGLVLEWVINRCNNSTDTTKKK